jgi:predicted DNA-binding protein
MTQRSQDVYALSVRLDRDLAERLKIISHRKHKSMAEIVREFVEWYVAKEEAVKGAGGSR